MIDGRRQTTRQRLLANRRLLAFAVMIAGAFPATLAARASEIPRSGKSASTVYDPWQDLPPPDPGIVKERKAAKKRLRGIDHLLLMAERAGKDTSCASQIHRELRWSLAYTTDLSRYKRRIGELEAIAEGRKAAPSAAEQSREDGSWGVCHEEWFFKLDTSSEALEELARANSLPRYPVSFLDRINSPDKLTAYLDQILISDVRKTGRDNRKELNYSVSALLRMVLAGWPPNYKYHPELRSTLVDYLIRKAQDPATGYFGAWYSGKAGLIRTEDLSLTFHIVSYLDGKAPHLGKIALTTYRNRENPYPYGVIEDDSYVNHHNYDAVRLFRYGWDELTGTQKTDIAREIRKMLEWCLTESLQSDGSFRQSPADDSLGDAFYFGVSFLDETGYFDAKKRFWTTERFPQAAADKERIRKRIVELGDKSYMARSALAKLGGSSRE